MDKNKDGEKRMSMLQIENHLIRNEEDIINALDFSLYAYLKYLLYINKGNNSIKFSNLNLMLLLGINDNRTLKKMIANLQENGTIISKKKESKSTTTVEVNMKNHIENFTQLPTNLLTHIPAIGHVGFRLLYFYESHINRTQGNKKSYCFTGYEDITSSLGISTATLSKYNKILVESKLLKITKHKLESTFKYNSKGLVMFDKYNNYYFPIINNMIKKKDETTNERA